MEDKLIIARAKELKKIHANDRKRYLFEMSKLLQYNEKL